MRVAILKSGVVTNVILAGSVNAAPLEAGETAVAAAPGVGPGWSYDGAAFAPPPPAPEPVPDKISDRQFAQGLAGAGLITQAEALEWVGPGVLPAAIAAFIAGLPLALRFDAEMVLKGATEFRRSHPMTAMFGGAVGMSPAQVDDFWRLCATL